MVTDDLRNFVISSLKQGHEVDHIKSQLLDQGLSPSDIDDVFNELSDNIESSSEPSVLAEESNRQKTLYTILALGGLVLAVVVIILVNLFTSDNNEQEVERDIAEVTDFNTPPSSNSENRNQGLVVVPSEESWEGDTPMIDIVPDYEPKELEGASSPTYNTQAVTSETAPTAISNPTTIPLPTPTPLLAPNYDIPGLNFDNFDPTQFADRNPEEMLEEMFELANTFKEKDVELAKALRDCDKLVQSVEQPIFGIQIELTREILGWEDDKCHYKENLPRNGLNYCILSRSQIRDISASKIEIANSEEYTVRGEDGKTFYSVDGGPEKEDPMAAAVASGDCDLSFGSISS